MTTEPTPAGSPALEIRVTLTGGDACRFAVDDPAQARRVLADVHPSRLFAQPHLLLGGDGSLTVLPCAHIERVDLVGPDVPDWPFLGAATLVREVTAEEFRSAYAPEPFAADRRQAAAQPGAAQVGFTEHWTRSGRRLFWEVHMESQAFSPVDFRPYIQTLLGSGGLHARTAEGGVAILNPANLTRLTFHPGPPTLPPGAWPGRRL